MVKVVSSELKYDGRIIKVFSDIIQQDGARFPREWVKHGGGSCVLAERDGKFAFVRQYRHPLLREVLELPAGTRDGDELPEITAVRELSEECGLLAKSIRKICDFAVSPGYTSEILHVYYSNEFDQSEQNLDEDESLSVEWIDKKQVFEMLKEGKIKDSKTIIALQWYLIEKNQ